MHPLWGKSLGEKRKKISSLRYWIDSVRYQLETVGIEQENRPFWVQFFNLKSLKIRTELFNYGEVQQNNDEEFDPGSGWTLAAGLTHASRTVTWVACNLMTSGARVRNAYTTYPLQGDSPGKLGLTPHGMLKWHHLNIKTPVVGDGYASY